MLFAGSLLQPAVPVAADENAIAVDGSNNAYAVWQDSRDGNKTPDPDIKLDARLRRTAGMVAEVDQEDGAEPDDADPTP